MFKVSINGNMIQYLGKTGAETKLLSVISQTQTKLSPKSYCKTIFVPAGGSRCADA